MKYKIPLNLEDIARTKPKTIVFNAISYQTLIRIMHMHMCCIVFISKAKKHVCWSPSRHTVNLSDWITISTEVAVRSRRYFSINFLNSSGNKYICNVVNTIITPRTSLGIGFWLSRCTWRSNADVKYRETLTTVKNTIIEPKAIHTTYHIHQHFYPQN